MNPHEPSSRIRPLAVAVLVAFALAGTAATARLVYGSQPNCIDYQCAADEDCKKVAGCNVCVGDAGKKRCAVTADPD